MCESNVNDLNNATVRRWANKSINPSSSGSAINMGQLHTAKVMNFSIRRGDYNSVGFGDGTTDRPYGALSPAITESGDQIVDIHRQGTGGHPGSIILIFNKDIGHRGKYRIFFEDHTRYYDIPFKDFYNGRSRFAVLGGNPMSDWLLGNRDRDRKIRMFRI